MDTREATRLTASSEPPGMIFGTHSYGVGLPNSSMASPNSVPIMQNIRFPFSSVAAPVARSSDSSTSPYHGMSEPAKKKRGRPRKYGTDGSVSLALASNSSAGPTSSGAPASEPSLKRNRGRPPGSGKKQLDALGNCGSGFTPHVITVNPGEDIASKILEFSRQGPRTVCILSANGSISNVTLRQPATSSGVVKYEGRFEIISISGSLSLTEDAGGTCSRTGGLSVSLAASDGRVLGGGVAGMLTAATPVQVIVGSFITEGKKPKSSMSIHESSSVPSPQMVGLGAPVATSSPHSQGTSSESSGDHGSALNRGSVIYNNAGQPAQIYSSIGWASPHSANPYKQDQT